MSKILKDPDFLDRLKRVEAKQRDMENGTTAIRPNARFLPVGGDTPPPEPRYYFKVFMAVEMAGYSGETWSEFAGHETEIDPALDLPRTFGFTIELFKKKVTLDIPGGTGVGAPISYVSEPSAGWTPDNWFPSVVTPGVVPIWRTIADNTADGLQWTRGGLTDAQEGIDAAAGFESTADSLNFAGTPNVLDDFASSAEAYSGPGAGDPAAFVFDGAGPGFIHPDVDWTNTAVGGEIELIPLEAAGYTLYGTESSSFSDSMVRTVQHARTPHPFYGGYHFYTPSVDFGVHTSWGGNIEIRFVGVELDGWGGYGSDFPNAWFLGRVSLSTQIYKVG